MAEIGELNPQAIGEWWHSEKRWLDFAGVQTPEGYDYERDNEDYRYVWMEAYVDGDMISHFLLEVRTRTPDASWEERQYVAVTVLPFGEIRTAVHDQVSGFRDTSLHHRLRFAAGMKWFTDFIQESEDIAYGLNEEKKGTS